MENMRYIIRRKRNAGFTLTEIMVVVVLSVMLLLALYDVFINSFKGVVAGKNKLSNLQDAAIALEYVKQDIKGAYLKKTFIKGKEVDGESLFKGGEGELEFSAIVYDQNGEERLIKISYKYDGQTESLVRTEEGGPTKTFAKGKIKKFSATLVKVDKISYVDTIIRVETENRQKVELRNAVFPKDLQAVNKHWIPNPY